MLCPSSTSGPVAASATASAASAANAASALSSPDRGSGYRSTSAASSGPTSGGTHSAKPKLLPPAYGASTNVRSGFPLP
ncbi:hypothetical protein GCM10022222_63580 [Amycolatopsis ultiminotia]|uniref:Uncharacterized protein n=1 Tax=Amycolatopsis ultiminotia TaxID=543629 RepID=A0ABP6XUG2_9PSEU